MQAFLQAMIDPVSAAALSALNRWGAKDDDGVEEEGPAYPIDAAGHATVPEDVTALEEEAFCGCSSLTALTLPASLATIGDRAFYGCSSLTTLTLPASLTTIGPGAFDGCSSLTTLTIVSDNAEPRVLTREQPFDTVAVRQALAQAVRQALAQALAA